MPDLCKIRERLVENFSIGETGEILTPIFFISLVTANLGIDVSRGMN